LLTVLLLLLVIIGCAQEERKIVSRPMKALPNTVGDNIDSEMTTEPVVDNPVDPGELADCQQLSTSDISDIFGGSWVITDDCPQRPAMPAGVDVCQCSYDGPKQLYVNVETQIYDAHEEAVRVFNMYCEESADKSCFRLSDSSVGLSYTYFLKDNYFVKLSCLGGSCGEDKLGELADTIMPKI